MISLLVRNVTDEGTYITLINPLTGSFYGTILKLPNETLTLWDLLTRI